MLGIERCCTNCFKIPSSRSFSATRPPPERHGTPAKNCGHCHKLFHLVSHKAQKRVNPTNKFSRAHACSPTEWSITDSMNCSQCGAVLNSVAMLISILDHCRWLGDMQLCYWLRMLHLHSLGTLSTLDDLFGLAVQ